VTDSSSQGRAKVDVGVLATTACPHDCPSTCALEVSFDGAGKLGKVRGSKDNSYTNGIICGKVARYRERANHPDRLMYPLRRKGGKDSTNFEKISWDDALDEISERFLELETTFGSECIWPYYFAGTMGLVMRDGINRLRNTKQYSKMHATICTTLAWTGFVAGTGRLAGPDPREMAKSDLIVIWGTNPVNTQINVMSHALEARKKRGAKIVTIDVYRTDTMAISDLGIIVRPGTDGALACAVIHCLLRDGRADVDFLRNMTDFARDVQESFAAQSPDWASGITGVDGQEIERFAALIGSTPKTYFRLGYGFSRHRNGAHNMHAATCIASVTGSWKHEGGGAFHNNGGIFHWNKNLIEGLDAVSPSVRTLDMSRIGPILCGDSQDLAGGPPVKALLIQNMNPAQVAPDQTLVKKGLMRDDLFVVTHEQFMTATAQLSDIVLPATMFFEHDDIYQGGGQQHIQFGPKLVSPPGECRSNHDVVCALARRLGASHRGFDMTPEQIIDETLQTSGWGSLANLRERKWLDCQPDFATAHFRDGFGYADGRFRFKPDWSTVPVSGRFDWHLADTVPRMPGHWDCTDNASDARPFKLVTAPARNYLNSTFNETATSRRLEGSPTIKIHPLDLNTIAVRDGNWVVVGNERGTIELRASSFSGLQRGVVIIESIPPNDLFPGGRGLNTLTSADRSAPFGGAVFHDTSVWIRPRPDPD
jgi:anaerobic selenocysteine-containing dehydrogenase